MTEYANHVCQITGVHLTHSTTPSHIPVANQRLITQRRYGLVGDFVTMGMS